ncbi:MAG: chemosensory pili system protein ChpA (sensor histidine kinase/response regulator) [Flavobacteriales bacterium]|jgi:chemosensory pili system protein ChpA (sensor histidine kinase/response regulator)
MSERRNFLALESVFREIEETLKQAREALETYVEDKDDKAQIRFCLSYLHQVHSTLKIVDFPGAVTFAAEIQSLAEMIANGKSPDQEKGEDALMGSMLRLPMYLNSIVAEREESPRMLQTALAEIKTAKGEVVAGDEELFSPNIKQVQPSAVKSENLPQKEFEELVKKLRQVFQAAFVDIVRNKRWGPNLRTLAKVCQRLKKLSQGHAREPLWKISLAIIEGLINRSIPPSNAVKSLLKEIDKELKGLHEQGSSQLDKDVSADLLRQLLYFIAKSDADSPLIKEVQEDYHLKEALAALAESDYQGQLDDSAMGKAIGVLLGEISLVKDVLDIFVRTGEGSLDQLKDAQPIYKRIADTLSVLGLENITESMRAQMIAFDAYVEAANVEDKIALVSIASELIRSEDLLNQYVNKKSKVGDGEDPHFAEARDKVIKEARNELDRAKESIVDFVASQWDVECLLGVSSSLGEIRGGLAMVGLARAARVVHAVQRYIDEVLCLGQASQSWQNLDVLADAISGLDYYLELVNSDIRNIDSEPLDFSATSMGQLGYPEERLDQIPVPEAARAEIEVEPEPDVKSAEVVPFPTATAVFGAEQSDNQDLIDDEIIEIFIEEVDEVLEIINQQLPAWKQDNNDQESKADVRRSYHTLKGSGRTVGANIIGELAWAVEDMLNDIMEDVVKAEPKHFLYLEKVTAIIPSLIEAFGCNVQADTELSSSYEAAARAIKAGEDVDIEGLAIVGASGQDDSIADDTPSIQDVKVEATNTAHNVEENNEILQIFLTETAEHLATIDDFVVAGRQTVASKPVTDDLQRALHTLKGSTHMAETKSIGEVVTPIERLIKHLQIAQIPASTEVISLLALAADYIRTGLTQLNQGDKLERFDGVEEFLVVVDSLYANAEQGSGDQLVQDLAELMGTFADRLYRIGDIHTAYNDGSLRAEDTIEYKDHLDGITVTAVDIKQAPLIEITEKLRDAFARNNEVITDVFVAVGTKAVDAITAMLDSIAAGLRVHSASPTLVQEIDDLVVNDDIPEQGDFEQGEITADIHVIDEGVTLETEREEAERVEPERVAAEKVQVVVDIADHRIARASGNSVFADMPSSKVDEQVDDDIKEIFLEEAHEILESLDVAAHQWLSAPAQNNEIDQLLRDLHTLKGSARLAGSFMVGDVSHHFESYLTNFERKGLVADSKFFADLQEFQDRLMMLVEAIESDTPVEIVQESLVPVEIDAVITIDDDVIEVSQAIESAEVLPVVVENAATAAAISIVEKGPQELVKVSAGLLEDLVNLAGETSISRGRVEERVTDIVYSLDEMDVTLERMQEQLRRLDIETQAQILFRQEQVESSDEEEFDPLEMDRYSVLQQLSRSLIESSSDIQDVKFSIFDNTRDLETLLLQQSRINTDLQEGLMRSRMVPFSRLAPRLRRIVRQVSNEVGKKVNLVMDNIEGEMDRTLLEKMLAPFEHMLRNAVDHGIEPAAGRVAAGKSESGTVSIELAREGGEVVIRLTDDGKGLNIDAIKNKAIKAGLMAPDAGLTDHEIQQFILEAGLSTATKVTQLSGRGVGMDVVNSEIKQLGGTVDIHSEMGIGTEFEVRLPFTVSVNRALMVQVAGDTYALPLNTIEGIARISPFELEAYFLPDAPLFEYGGQGYDLRYMGSMLHLANRPNLEGVNSPLPVILVRSADHAVAVQVDSLLGSREVVVKTLGLQFNAVPGLAGATVTGDGSVIVILDLHSMIRAEAASAGTKFIESDVTEIKEERNQLVMVVDDSVTVRKVASRFLERNGKDVFVAKDGVEAMAILQDRKPDVMLLDIEMPRMDGFEVASRVKRSQSLKDITIIMITSRTGEKHRERAMALGVDYYLGKPYQEAELLALLEEITANAEA